MIKRAEGVLISALLLLIGCGTQSTPSPQAASPTPVAAAPSSPAATAPSAAPANAPEPSEAVASTEAAVEAAENDLLVVPGERVGPVTRNTTRKDLVALFGEANLKDEDISMGEGEMEPGTVVNAGTERSLTIVWTDTTRTQLAGIRNMGSAWKTPEGIGVGTTFAELQEKLGEFQLYGFDWDYGGTVMLEGSNLKQYDGLLVLRLQPAANAAEKAPEDYKAVIGDALFPSTDPHFQTLDITVDEMAVSLDQEG